MFPPRATVNEGTFSYLPNVERGETERSVCVSVRVSTCSYTHNTCVTWVSVCACLCECKGCVCVYGSVHLCVCECLICTSLVYERCVCVRVSDMCTNVYKWQMCKCVSVCVRCT